MNDIQIFNSPQFGQIRTSGTPDSPLFCATDVCRALGYKNRRDAVRKHCDERGVAKCDTSTTNQHGSTYIQQLTFVDESGLYSLIFGSKLKAAKEFKYWVTSEVLPSIRRHGMYATGSTIERIIADPDSAIEILQAMQKERKERIEAEQRVSELEQQAEENRPKVIFSDAVSGSTSSCLIGELAKMICQNGVAIGERRLYQWLRDHHYLCAYGERYNQPYQQYIEQGLFTMKQNVFSVNGEMRTRNTTKVTGKGQVYFINKFLADHE